MQEENQAEEFLEITIRIIPWDEWIGAMETCFPKRKRGGVSMGIEKLLRMYSLQSWFNLPGPAKEDAIFGSCAIRKFTDIDFVSEAVPDETTLCKFRHFLGANSLYKLFFHGINRVMAQAGRMMKGGSHYRRDHHHCAQLHEEHPEAP